MVLTVALKNDHIFVSLRIGKDLVLHQVVDLLYRAVLAHIRGVLHEYTMHLP